MNLNDERKAWLIKQLALKVALPKIKETYILFFEDKILGEELIVFESENRKLIEQAAKRELNDIKKEPLAHARTRLQILNDALSYAMTPRATKSVIKSVNEHGTEYEITMEPDYGAIVNIVKAAQNEEFFIKKLLMDIKRLDLAKDEAAEIASTGFEVVPIDDGIKRISYADETKTS